MENKLRECFEDMVVYKDLKKSNFFSSLGLPSFLRDWVLKKFEVTRQSDAADDRIKEAYAKTPEYQVAFDQLQYAVGDYMNAGYTEAAKIYTDAVDKIMSDQGEVQATLDDAKQQADKALQQ